MKVKELIENLQKQNQEDEIHIWVDDEVGCGAGLFGRYHATDIGILGHDKYYQKENGEMKSLGELEEELYHIEENCHYLEMLTRAYRDAILNQKE